MPHIRFPDRLRLPLDYDPEALAADMAAVAAAGRTEHFVKQNYDGDWSVIALRGPAGAKHPIQMIYSDPACTDLADTPALAAAPYFQVVLASLACPLQAVRLMRLAPGSLIKEHRDHDLAFEEGTVRLHIPVTTNDGVDFASTASAAPCRPVRLGTCGSRTRTASPTGGRPTACTWSSTPWSTAGSAPCSTGRPSPPARPPEPAPGAAGARRRAPLYANRAPDGPFWPV
jgi:Aspartyl/Asparaginyl beta-hydroxylase